MPNPEPPGPFSTGHMADSPFEGGSSFDPAETVVALGAPSSSSNSASQPPPSGAVTNVPKGQGFPNQIVPGTMSRPPQGQGYPNQNVPGTMSRPPQGQGYPNQNVPGTMSRPPQGQGYPNQNVPGTMSRPPQGQGYPNQNVPGTMSRPPQGQAYPNQNVQGAVTRVPQGQGYPNQNVPGGMNRPPQGQGYPNQNVPGTMSRPPQGQGYPNQNVPGAVTRIPQGQGYPNQNMPGGDPRFANAGMQGGQWNGPQNYGQSGPMPQQGPYGQPAFNNGPAPSWQSPQGGQPSAQGYGQPPSQGFGPSGPFSNPGAGSPPSGSSAGSGSVGSNANSAPQGAAAKTHSSRRSDGSRSSRRNANEEVGKGVWLLVGGMVFLFIVISIILYNHFAAPAPVIDAVPENTQNVYVPPSGDTGFLDPVSGEPVDPATTPYFVDLGGTTFYFTADDHRSRFMADPYKYVTPQYKVNPNAPPANAVPDADGGGTSVPEPESVPDTSGNTAEPDANSGMDNGYSAPENDVPSDTSGSVESAPSYNDVPPPDDSGSYEEEEVVPPSGDADFAPPGSGNAGAQVPADGQGAGGSSEDTPGWVP
ncbi:MAG: hypothetical protein K6G50_04785 [bacterium]|nr:hypothetical protein [bacterium]